MKLNEEEGQRYFHFCIRGISPLDKRASSNVVIIIIILNDNGVLGSSLSDPHDKQAKLIIYFKANACVGYIEVFGHVLKSHLNCPYPACFGLRQKKIHAAFAES